MSGLSALRMAHRLDERFDRSRAELARGQLREHPAEAPAVRRRHVRGLGAARDTRSVAPRARRRHLGSVSSTIWDQVNVANDVTPGWVATANTSQPVASAGPIVRPAARSSGSAAHFSLRFAGPWTAGSPSCWSETGARAARGPPRRPTSPSHARSRPRSAAARRSSVDRHLALPGRLLRSDRARAAPTAFPFCSYSARAVRPARSDSSGREHVRSTSARSSITSPWCKSKSVGSISATASRASDSACSQLPSRARTLP